MVTGLQALKDKYLKDPDIIPPKGKTKDDVVEELVTQKIKQSRNNERAFELMTKEQEEAGGYVWDKENPQRTWEDKKGPRFEIAKETPEQYGDPSISHLRIMHRPLKILPGSADDYKVDDPPELESDEIKTGLNHIKRAKGFLEGKPELEDEISEQDDDILHPFLEYAEENDLKVDEQYLENLMADVSTIAMHIKYKHNMPRPWQYKGMDEPKDTETDTPSYPSGHSAQAKVAAEVLAGSYPEHKQQFEDIGDRVGLNRVMAGWHFPVDHSSGRDLADQILEKLPKNTDMYLKKSGLGEDDYMSAIKTAMEKHAEDFNIPTGMFKSLLSKEVKDVTAAATKLAKDGIFKSAPIALQWLRNTGIDSDSEDSQIEEAANNWRSYHQSLPEGERKPIGQGKFERTRHLEGYKAHIKPKDTPTAPTAAPAGESASKPEYYVIGDSIEKPGVTPPRENARPATIADLADSRIKKPNDLPKDHANHPQFGGVTVEEYRQAQQESEERLGARTKPLTVTPSEERASQRDVEEAKKYGVTFDTDPKGTVTIADTEDNRVTVSGIFSRNLDDGDRKVRSIPLPTKAKLVEAGESERTLSEYDKEIKRRGIAYGKYVEHKNPVRSAEDDPAAKFKDTDGNEVSRDTKGAIYVADSGTAKKGGFQQDKLKKEYADADESRKAELYQRAVKDVPDIIHVNTGYNSALDIDSGWKIDTPSVDPDTSNLDPADTLWERAGTEGFRPEDVAAARGSASTPDPERQAQFTEAMRSRSEGGDINITKDEARWLAARGSFWDKKGKLRVFDVPTRLPESKYASLVTLAQKRTEPGYHHKANHYEAMMKIMAGGDEQALRDLDVQMASINYKESDDDNEISVNNDIDVNEKDVEQQQNHDRITKENEGKPEAERKKTTEPTRAKAKAAVKKGTRKAKVSDDDIPEGLADSDPESKFDPEEQGQSVPPVIPREGETPKQRAVRERKEARAADVATPKTPDAPETDEAREKREERNRKARERRAERKAAAGADKEETLDTSGEPEAKKPTGTGSSGTQPEAAAGDSGTTKEPAEAAEFDTSNLSASDKNQWDELKPSDAVHIETDGTPRPMTSVTMDGVRQAFVRNENGSWSPITGVKNVLSDENGVPHLRTATTPFEVGESKTREDLQPAPDDAPYKRIAAFSDPQRSAFQKVGQLLAKTNFGSDSEALSDANAINARLDTGVRKTADDERIGSAVNSHINAEIDSLFDDQDTEQELNGNALHEFSHEGGLSESTSVMGSEGREVLQGHLDRLDLGKLKDMSDDALLTAAAPTETASTEAAEVDDSTRRSPGEAQNQLDEANLGLENAQDESIEASAARRSWGTRENPAEKVPEGATREEYLAIQQRNIKRLEKLKKNEKDAEARREAAMDRVDAAEDLVAASTETAPTATVTPSRTEAERIREENAAAAAAAGSGGDVGDSNQSSDLTNGEADFDKFFGKHESDFQAIYDHRYKKTGRDKHHSFDDFKEARRQKFDKNRATFTDSFSDEVFKVNNEKAETAAEDESNKAAQEERRAKAGQLETDVKFSTPSKQEQMHELIEHIVEQEKKKLPENRRFTSPVGAHDWYTQNGDHPNIDAWKEDAEKAHKEIQAKKAKAESSQAGAASTAETAAKTERKEKAEDAITDLEDISRDGSEGTHAIEEKLIAATKLAKDHKEAFAENRGLNRKYRSRIKAMAKFAGQSGAGKDALQNLDDEHKKHGDEGFLGDDHTQSRTDAHNKAKENHDKHEEHINAVNKQGFDHASFSHEDAEDNQKLQKPDEKGHNNDLKAGGESGKTDAEIAQDRIRRGLPPGAAPRPGLEWHKETHRWVNPDVYKDVGGMLKAGESVHIADPESMGLAHHEDTTPGGGILVDDKGNMYNASAAQTNKYGLKSLDHSDLAHSPSEAQHQRSIAANHMVVNGKHSIDQQELERRLKINHVVTGLDDFAKRRRKGALSSFLKPIAMGAAVGALGGVPGAAVGGALGAALAFKGLNRLRQYSKHKIADKIKQDMPNMTNSEREVLDAYTGKKSNLKSGVGTALKYAAVASISPHAAGLMASPAAGRLGMRAARAAGRGVRSGAGAGVGKLNSFVNNQINAAPDLGSRESGDSEKE